MSDLSAGSDAAVTFTVVDGAGVHHKAEVSAVVWSTAAWAGRSGAYTVTAGGRTMHHPAAADRREAVLQTALWAGVVAVEVLVPGEASRAELLAHLAEAERKLAAGFVSHGWKEGEVAGRDAAADFHKRMAAHHRKRAEETSKELTCTDELEAAKHDLYETLIRELPLSDGFSMAELRESESKSRKLVAELREALQASNEAATQLRQEIAQLRGLLAG